MDVMAQQMPVKQDIELVKMPQLREAFDKEDDWTGLTDAAARRRRQNRLNQRAYRKRKILDSRGDSASDAENPQPPFICKSESGNQAAVQNNCHQITTTRTPTMSTNLAIHIPPNRHNSFQDFRAPAQVTIPAIIFPLSLDHLIVLVHYNVFRALLTNMSILQLLHSVPAECGNMIHFTLFDPPSTLPPNLAPTPLQLSTPHPFWIDIIPLGKLRDNMILAEGSYDNDDMCNDIVGGLWDGFNDCESRGLVAWNNPWEISGWEVSEGFFKKWGWLLKGCREAIEATNHWRSIRGDDLLVIEN